MCVIRQVPVGVLRDDVIGLGRRDSLERAATVWDHTEASDLDTEGLEAPSVQM